MSPRKCLYLGLPSYSLCRTHRHNKVCHTPNMCSKTNGLNRLNRLTQQTVTDKNRTGSHRAGSSNNRCNLKTNSTRGHRQLRAGLWHQHSTTGCIRTGSNSKHRQLRTGLLDSTGRSRHLPGSVSCHHQCIAPWLTPVLVQQLLQGPWLCSRRHISRGGP